MEYDFQNLSEEEIVKLVREGNLLFRNLPKEHQTEAICLEALKLDCFDIDYIVNQTEKIKWMAIKENCWTIGWMDNPTEEMKLKAVKEDGYIIQFIDNPSIEMKLEAVKNYGLALEFIKEQTLEICLEAVKENILAILFINKDLLDEFSNQSPNVKYFKCQKRTLLCEKINNQWLFSIGCQRRITKKEFIDRIYNHDGGLEKNPHRKEYLKILEQF